MCILYARIKKYTQLTILTITMTTAPKRKPQATKRKIREPQPTYGVEEMQRAMHILALMQGSAPQIETSKRSRQTNTADKKKASPLLEYQNLRASAAAAGVSVVDGSGRPLKKAAIQLALDAKNGTKVLAPVVSPATPTAVPVEPIKTADPVKPLEVKA
jgi:hypothetical protein